MRGNVQARFGEGRLETCRKVMRWPPTLRSFLREISSHDFRRLIKTPISFDVQLSQMSGLRTELFDALRLMLELPLQEDRQAKILDVVRPLFVLAAQLPEYTKKTKNLTSTALSVRNVLLAAREPGPFLFRDLPQACGFEEAIAVKISEPRLRALCLRLIDTLPENEWLEALGSFICSKIPASWTDIDEQRFKLELNQLCTWFRRVEVTLFSEGQRSTGDPVFRVAVTQSDGKEVDRVLYATSEEEEEVMHIQADIMKVLRYNKHAGLIAISRAFLQVLSQEEGDQA